MTDMKQVLNLYKRIGETPLERIERFRKQRPRYKDVKMSYVGRLDPLAEGVLLVVAGETAKKREKYLKSEKEYIVDVLFGIRTDSYDILGKVSGFSRTTTPITNAKVEEILKKFRGEMWQEYPPYSSKPVKGKPLFEWAREGRLNEIKIPKKKIKIYNTNVLKCMQISKTALHKYIKSVIKKVRGDFRQKEILEIWSDKFNKSRLKKFPICQIKIKSSSGTYMRTIANDLGKKLNPPIGGNALALRIKRTKVGRYTIEKSLK